MSAVHVERESVAKRLARLVAAGVLASAMCAPVAFAADDDRNGDDEAATTTLVMKFDDDTEYTQSNANLKFTVPAQVNFAAKADGTLTGANSYIENDSTFSVHASSMLVTAQNDWNIVSDVADLGETLASNDVSLNVTGQSGIAERTADTIDAAAHLEAATKAIANKASWEMSATATDPDEGIEATDRVKLSMAGAIANVTKDLNEDQTFGTIQWYVTVGSPAAAQAPETPDPDPGD